MLDLWCWAQKQIRIEHRWSQLHACEQLCHPLSPVDGRQYAHAMNIDIDSGLRDHGVEQVPAPLDGPQPVVDQLFPKDPAEIFQ